jgi:Family of unknown function (DUF6011)
MFGSYFGLGARMTGQAAGHTAKCLRCGRKLTASAALGYGPACRRRIRDAAAVIEIPGATPAQVTKAAQLIADGGIIPTSRKGIYRAVSSDGSVVYIVSVHGNCNCPHGLHATTARPCYHALAARILDAASIRRAAPTSRKAA